MSLNLKAITQHKRFRPVCGAGLAVLCGLSLWQMPLGERWVNASYDYLFRFGARSVTNKVVLILMDNKAYADEELHQVRERPWDRALHAKLLNKLADDACPLVVFDVSFHEPREPKGDEALARALRRQGAVVLMAEHAGVAHPEGVSAEPTPPAEPFRSAVSTNGVAWLDPDLDEVVRRHWPFPAPGPYPSLPWAAAELAGAQLSAIPQHQWLRYYGRSGPGTSLSYPVALTQATNYFRDKIVFIGNKPKTTVPKDGEEDEFSTPYRRWTGESSGGVEILAAEFLNLVNGEWLRRPAWWVEVMVLLIAGVLLGGGLCQARPLPAFWIASGAGLIVTLGAVSWSYFTNYWFPWLVTVGGQVPCGLAWALLAPRIRYEPVVVVPKTVVIPKPPAQAAAPLAQGRPPGPVLDTPEYELFGPPFAEGGYGKVWLVRNAIGQWQALKVVYLEKFDQNADPYEREFNGIRRYKPISDRHPGLLRVDFVSRKKREGYFYYVMELGDAQAPGWEENPTLYKPRDLARVRAQAEGRRLPAAECVRIAIALTEALDFLHRQGLTHRDIKPSNIIFVNGQPKLADVGLVTEIRPSDQVTTLIGTAGYMPPPPEPPGTAQADIYALGMLLYVISTGRDPGFFPELSTTLVERDGRVDFFRLNGIILKACHPDCPERYLSAAEMRAALLEAQKALGDEAAPQRA